MWLGTVVSVTWRGEGAIDSELERGVEIET